MSYLRFNYNRSRATALRILIVAGAFVLPSLSYAVDRFWDMVDMRPGTGGSGCSVITTYREAWYENGQLYHGGRTGETEEDFGCETDSCDGSAERTGPGLLSDTRPLLFQPDEDFTPICMTCSEGDLNEDFGISAEAWVEDYANVLPGGDTYIPPKPLVMLANHVVDHDVLTMPLGLNDHGQSLGVLAIDPDVASDAPLTVNDVDRQIKFLADLAEVERIVVSATLHQIATPSLLFIVEELPDGGLSLRSYSIDDVTYDETFHYFTVNASGFAQTDLIVSRLASDASTSGLPSIRFNGTVKGVPFNAVHARIVEEGVGSISEVIENGVRRVTVDHFTEDSSSASGYSRTRSVSEYRHTSA